MTSNFSVNWLVECLSGVWPTKKTTGEQENYKTMANCIWQLEWLCGSPLEKQDDVFEQKVDLVLPVCLSGTFCNWWSYVMLGNIWSTVALR